MADENDDQEWKDAARAVAEGAARTLTKGVTVGDFVAKPVVSLSTDDHLDTNENRERSRREDDDARAAQQAGAVAPDGIDLLHPAHPPAPEHTALDDALDDARARAAGTADLPMILHDPVTGLPIGGG